MRQLRLIPSGVQKWHRDTIATTGTSFAYSSTMALHIFRLKDFSLSNMIVAHDRTITSICWSPFDCNLLASCSASKRISIWDLDKEVERHGTKVAELPVLMDWAITGDRIAVALETGQILVWEYTQQDKQTKLFSVGDKSARVLRWHPRSAAKLIVGTSEGSLHVHLVATGKKTHILGKSKTSKDAVTDAQWDPLSEDYLLVSFQDGSLALYDVSSSTEIHTFDIQSQPVKSIAWAKAQPGNFLTSTERVGVLKLWNVSQRTPLSQIKVGHSGVNCLKAFPLDPNCFLISFKNTSLGVCDIGTKTMKFMSSPGHSETIFDVVFHPVDPDMIATASYDGSIKLWRISTSESHREMFAGADQLLYGLAFGPGAAHICAVSGSGLLFIWKAETGEQVLRLQVHTGHAYRCEWNMKGGRHAGTGDIATGGADGFVCITDAASGSVKLKIQHPAAAIGVQWHPSVDNILASACQDGKIRIFNLSDAKSAEQPKPQVVMEGHEARVFNIAYHPVCHDLLASGSDDRTVRLWTCGSSVPSSGSRQLRKLCGHTSNVRGLVWHTALPCVLLSGSWDSTIRIWDVVIGKCLHICNDHHADVYGLASHPQRPFFFVSSSRDTTLRFWVHEDVARPMLVHALVQPWRFGELLGHPDEILSAVLSDSAAPAPRKLYGQAVNDLWVAIQKTVEGRCDHAAAADVTQRSVSLDSYRRIVSFFMYRQGMEDLWGLLATIRGEQLPAAPKGLGPPRKVFHECELIQCQKSRALELASGKGGMSVAGKQEERLLKAAQIMLRVGDIRSYCRFTAQAGHWERAICIAPAVSQKFWADLCNEYIETLSATADLEDCAPFWIATGKGGKLVGASIERSELDKAFVLSKAEADGLLPSPPDKPTNAAPGAVREPGGDAARLQFENVAANLAQLHSDMGSPVQAAMCFLAVSQAQHAASLLSRSHEPVLSYVVADLLGLPKDPVDLKLLALCAERDQWWSASADMLQSHPSGPTLLLPLLAARCPDKELSMQWSAWTADQYREGLDMALSRGDMPSAVLAAVCAGESEKAAEVGVEALYAMFRRPDWTVVEARALMEPLEALPLQDMAVKDIANILACASYLGLVEASENGYHDMVFPLAQTLRNIVTHQNLQFPVHMAEVSMIEAVGTATQQPGAAVAKLEELLARELPAHLHPVCQQHVAAIQQAQAAGTLPTKSVYRGLGKIAGGGLPTGYKKHAKRSVLTNALIKGPSFELEDHQLHVSLSDALAWVRVNAFSPLNTGCKIQPV